VRRIHFKANYIK
jgi:hypothetical protein